MEKKKIVPYGKMSKKAKKEQMGDFDPEDLLFVIQGDFEFWQPEEDEEDKEFQEK